MANAQLDLGLLKTGEDAHVCKNLTEKLSQTGCQIREVDLQDAQQSSCDVLLLCLTPSGKSSAEILNRLSGRKNGHSDGESRLDAIERAHIVTVLRREQGNKARSARTLGVNRRSLYRLIEKHGIAPEIYGSSGSEPAV